MCPLHRLHCLASRACVSPICMAHTAFKAGANALGGSGAGPCRHCVLHCLSETRPLDCSQVPAQRNLSVQIHQDTSRYIKQVWARYGLTIHIYPSHIHSLEAPNPSPCTIGTHGLCIRTLMLQCPCRIAASAPASKCRQQVYDGTWPKDIQGCSRILCRSAMVL